MDPRSPLAAPALTLGLAVGLARPVVWTVFLLAEASISAEVRLRLVSEGMAIAS